MQTIQLKFLESCHLSKREIEAIDELISSHVKLDLKNKIPPKNKFSFLLDILSLSLLNYDNFKSTHNKILTTVINYEKHLTVYDKGRLWHNKGYLTWRYDDSIVIASQYLNKSIALLSQRKTILNQAYLARVHNTYGQILTKSGQIEDAIEEYKSASKYRKFNNDIEGYAITLGNIGRLYFEKGNFSQAKHYIKEDLMITESLPNATKGSVPQLLTNLAFCNIELAKYDDALDLLNRSLIINSKDNNETGQCFSNLGLAYLHCRLKDATKSEIYLEKVDQSLESGSIPEYLHHDLRGEFFRIKGESYLNKREYVSAIKYFSNAVSEFDSVTNFSPIRKSKLLFRLAKAYEAKDDLSKSAELMRKSLRLADLSEDFELRASIENNLKKSINKDSWLLHAAGRYLGHQQIDFLLNESGKQNLESGLKDVVVLFSDIRDFTSFSEKMEADFLINFLNEYISMMTRCIEHFNGYIDKYIGDAIMSIFSLPQTRPKGKNNDVEMASWAAIFMREELKRFNRVKAPNNLKLEAGIGIHTGKAVVGMIGSPQKRSYSAIGDTINLASRIEGLTKMLGAQILLTGEVMEKYENPDQFLFSYWGKYKVKGRENPVVVYELLGINDNTLQSRNLKEEIAEQKMAMAFFEKGNFLKSVKSFSELEVKYKSSKRCRGYQFLNSLAEQKIANNLIKWDGVIVLESK